MADIQTIHTVIMLRSIWGSWQTSAKTKAGWTQKYTLEGPYPDGKWLRCD
jgi:hypothetical protein